MDIPIRASSYYTATPLASQSSSSSSSFPSSSFRRIYCSRRSSGKPRPDEDDSKNKKGDQGSMDWDKGWSNFKKGGKQSFSSRFNADKYVSWNPRRSNYPLSEEVDPIKRTEKTNLMLWTSPSFTLGGAIVIVTFLLIYTLLAPVK